MVLIYYKLYSHMDLLKKLETLEHDLFIAKQSYSQSNSCQMLNIRGLQRDIKKIKQEIEAQEVTSAPENKPKAASS